MAIFYENQKGNVWVRADQIKSVCIDEMNKKFRVNLILPRNKSVKFGEFDWEITAKEFVRSMPERTIKL